MTKEYLDQQTALVNDLAAVAQDADATKVLEITRSALAPRGVL